MYNLSFAPVNSKRLLTWKTDDLISRQAYYRIDRIDDVSL